MTRDDFEQKQYEISVCAGMNQRYHQHMARLWSWWDRGFRFSVGVLTVLGASFAVVTAMTSEVGWEAFALFISSCAAIVAVLLSVLPFGEWSGLHLEFFRRWTDLREDIDALMYDLTTEPSDDLVRRLSRLDAKVHRICGAEPGCNKDLLDKCNSEEIKSRTPSAQTQTACAA
jgi:hypothetical protein